MLSGTTMMVSLRPFNGVSPYPSKHPLVHRNRQTALRGTIYMSAQTQAVPSRTQRIMESISVSGEVGGAGGAYSYNALKRLDGIWSSICSTQTVQQAPQQVVSSFPGVSSRSVLAEKQVDKCDVVAQLLTFAREKMDQYQKVEKPKAETPLNENELRIIVQGRNELSLEMTTPSVKKNNLMIGVVISVAFKTQINSWNSSIYSTGSSGAVRV